MPRYAFIVFSQPTAGNDAEYNRWYTEQHLPDVLAVPGFVAAERFKLAADDANAPAPYLAIYEIETNDVQATLADLNGRANTTAMPLSPSLDLGAVKTFLYQGVSPRQVAKGR